MTPFFEFNLAAVIQAGNATEGEHKVEILGPCYGAAGESGLFRWRFRGIVMTVNVHHIKCGIVIEFIASLCNAKSIGCFAKQAVHLEVDDVHARSLADVGSMILVAIEQGVIGCGLSFLISFVVITLF